MKLISLLVFFSEKSVEAGYVTEPDDFDVNTEQTMTSEDEHMMNYRVKVQCKMEFGVIEGFNSTDSCSDLYFENSCCEFGAGLSKICRCEYIENGPFMFPSCEWYYTDFCAGETTFPETTTEISTTTVSTFPTETSPETNFSTIESTTEPTTESTTDTTTSLATTSTQSNTGCPILMNPTNGAIYSAFNNLCLTFTVW